MNFSGIASEHMTDPNRHIPVQILREVIKTGKAMPDPRGSHAIMYYGKMFRGTKPYNVKVLYDKISNTVYHFKYSSEALGPLAAIK